MASIAPYFNFTGNCREAMAFYHSCLGGELTQQSIAESPIAANMPEAVQQHIMHAMLVADGATIMGSDMMAASAWQGNTVSVIVSCGSDEEIDRLFSKFAEGGRIVDPLDIKFWGDKFGALTDKFGINWAFNFAKKQ